MANQATSKTTTTPKFRRTAAVSLPAYSLDAGKDGAARSHFLKIETPFSEHKSEREGSRDDMMKATVVNLETGEQAMVYMQKGLAAKFEADQNYEIVVQKEAGKRYPTHTIYAIEVE